MKDNSNRRDFLKKSVVAGSVVAASGLSGTSDAAKKIKTTIDVLPDKLPAPIPKGLEYLLKVREMYRSVIKEDAAKIENAALICTQSIMNGGKIYYDDHGHGESQCILETVKGNPAFLIPLFDDESIITDKDVLISTYSSKCADAAKKGAKTIGVIYAFEAKKFQGQGIVNRDYKGSYIEEVCDVWFWDRTPFTVGILDFDLMPWKAIAAHGFMDSVILKLILAKTVDMLLEKGVKVETTV
jgi:uncharacterized phosphosugar-binding protein